MYEVETSVDKPSLDTNLDVIDPEWKNLPKIPTEETDASKASSLIKLLTVVPRECCSNFAPRLGRGGILGYCTYSSKGRSNCDD